MSGPKYQASPPPTFSAEVFEGRLHRLLDAASELRVVERTLASTTVSSRHRGPQEHGSDVVTPRRAAIDAAVARFTTGLPPRFGRSDRERVERDLDSRIARADGLRREMVAELTRLRLLQEDWSGWDEVCDYAAATCDGLARYAATIAEELRAHADTASRVKRESGAAEVEATQLPYTQPDFAPGYAKRVPAERMAIDEAGNVAHARLVSLTDSLGAELARDAARALARPDPREEARRSAADSARAAVAAVPDAEERRRLDAEITRLFASRIQTDPSLLDDIARRARAITNSHPIRERIGADLARLIDSPPTTAEARDAWAQAVDAGRRASAGLVVDPRLDAAFQGFARRAAELESAELRRAEIARSESAFVREEIVRGLRQRGYTVEPAATAIDFNSAKDVVLAAPGGVGLVTVAFEGAGVRYAYFATEEAKGHVAAAEARAHAVRSCDLFKETLDDLRNMGVPLPPVTTLASAEEAPLHVAPRKFRDRLPARQRADHGTQPRAKGVTHE